MAAAARANQSGNPIKALEILEAAGDKIASDPLGQLELGHARAARNLSAAALDAYGRALALAPELSSGSFIRSNLKAMTDGKAEDDQDQAVVARAFAMLLEHFELADTEARLLDAAQDPKATWRRRKAAQSVAEHYHLSDKLDRFTVASLDLTQGSGCDVRQQAIASLRALGDLRAIDLLQAIVDKYEEPAPKPRAKRTGRSRAAQSKDTKRQSRRKGEDYSCLLEDAQAALAFLRELQAQKAQEAGAAPATVDGELVLEPEPEPAKPDGSADDPRKLSPPTEGVASPPGALDTRPTPAPPAPPVTAAPARGAPLKRGAKRSK